MLFLSKWASKVPPFVAFCLIGGLNALVLVVLTPPFQVHDEFQHFFRSYQLSEGHVWATVNGNVAGGYLPSSLPAFVERTWGTLGLWITPPAGTALSGRHVDRVRETARPGSPGICRFHRRGGVLAIAIHSTGDCYRARSPAQHEPTWPHVYWPPRERPRSRRHLNLVSKITAIRRGGCASSSASANGSVRICVPGTRCWDYLDGISLHRSGFACRASRKLGSVGNRHGDDFGNGLLFY